MHVRCPHCHQPIQQEVETSLADLTCPECGSAFNLAADAMTATRVPGTRQAFGRFELLDQLGLGKFGSVWKARDPLLERIVAVKVPRKEQLDEGEMELFAREGRAAAQLRHPNVVSIHEVGREEGTIYIVSDYVAGANLQEWLSGQRLTSREAAELCVKIADALHHAHERGIIHRDLKPANIMLDMEGAPHVMDFGLAKRREADVTMTFEGQVLGTPAYMSPEQARGEGHHADRRSDVYSLGAILYELLTGEKPFRGELRMLIVQILREEPTPPRKLNGRIRRDLETICLKCLEKDPARRYATAAALKEDLQRYLDGEAIRARPVWRVEKTWRWSRRNPSAAGLVASLFLLLVLCFSGTLWYVQDQAARAAERARRQAEIARQSAQLEQEIGVVLNESGTLIERGWELVELPHQWKATLAAADSALSRAQALAARANPLEATGRRHLEQVKTQLAAANKNRRFAARIAAIRMGMTEVNVKESHFEREEAHPKLMEALAAYGLPPGDICVEEAARRIRRQRAPMRSVLYNALDLALFTASGEHSSESQWLRKVLAAADENRWRTAVRAAAAGDDATELKQLAREADVAEQPISILLHLAGALRADGAREGALALLRRIHLIHPDDFWVNHELASVLGHMEPPRWEQSIRHYVAALAVRPGNPGACLNYGWALQHSGDLTAAIAAYRRALELAPHYTQARINIGTTLQESGDLAAAIAAYRKAIETDPDSHRAYWNLAFTYYVGGDESKAIAAYRQAIELQGDIAELHYDLGRALSAMNEHAAAAKAFRRATELAPRHADAHYFLGHALRHMGEFEAAIAALRRVTELAPNHADSYYFLGFLLFQTDQHAAAVAALRRAIEVEPKHVRAHMFLGHSLEAKGDLDGAVAAYRKATRLDPQDADKFIYLGAALSSKGNRAKSIAVYRRALELEPQNRYALTSLANNLTARKDSGDLPEALRLCQQAIEIYPDYAEVRLILGDVYFRMGKYVKSEAAYREAIDRNPNFAVAHCKLGIALKFQGQYSKALAALKYGHKLGSDRAGWDYPSARYIRELRAWAQDDGQPTFGTVAAPNP